MWAEERGKSEYRSVTERIGVERKRHHPMRKQADFHMVFLYKRVCQEPLKEEKQMNADYCMCILLRLRKKAVNEYCKVGATVKCRQLQRRVAERQL